MRLIERLHAIIATERGPKPHVRIGRARLTDKALIGRGFADPRQRPGTRRIVVTLDDDDFDRVHAYAAARNLTFAAAVRELIKKNCGDSSTAERQGTPPQRLLPGSAGIEPCSPLQASQR